MSTQFEDDEDFDAEDEQTEGQLASWRKKMEKDLRASKKIAEDSQKRAEAAERKNLVYEAGLNSLKPKQITALLATHDGDLDAESLKLTAQELGFIEAPKTEVPKEEVEAHQAIDALSGGGTPQPVTALDDEIAAAKSPEEVMTILQKHNRPTTWNAPS